MHTEERWIWRWVRRCFSDPNRSVEPHPASKTQDTPLSGVAKAFLVWGIAGISFTTGAGFAKGDEAGAWMDRIQKKYSSLSTLQADFTQKFIQGKDQRDESGVLLLSRGARMRWDYLQPSAKIYLIDGRMQYIWIPSEKRVFRETLKASEDERKPILLLLGRIHWRKVFAKVEVENEDEQEVLLRAHPKDRSMGYETVRMKIEKNTLHLIQISIDNRDRSRMEFGFSNIIENARIDARRFAFRIPPGAEVVDQGKMP